jgi:hypothetical protein
MDSSPICDKDGNPVLDWEGKPVAGDGFSFMNCVASGNPALQAVRTDGKEVIIFNNLTDDQEKRVTEFFKGIETRAIDSVSRIQEAISKSVEIGAGDVYNSTVAFVNSKMVSRDNEPISLPESNNAMTVLSTQRNGEPVSFVRLDISGTFKGGPTLNGEKFVKGCAAISDGSNGFRLVEPSVFNATYVIDTDVQRPNLSRNSQPTM